MFWQLYYLDIMPLQKKVLFMYPRFREEQNKQNFSVVSTIATEELTVLSDLSDSE